MSGAAAILLTVCIGALLILACTSRTTRHAPCAAAEENRDFHLAFAPADDMTTPELISILRLSGALPSGILVDPYAYKPIVDDLGSASRHFTVVD